jgi:hypothetical protein
MVTPIEDDFELRVMNTAATESAHFWGSRMPKAVTEGSLAGLTVVLYVGMQMMVRGLEQIADELACIREELQDGASQRKGGM